MSDIGRDIDCTNSSFQEKEEFARTWATEMLNRIHSKADNAYCDYIGQMMRDECLGWEIKIERGKFGEVELKSHCAAAEKLGRHRALFEAANMLNELLKEIKSELE